MLIYLLFSFLPFSSVEIKAHAAVAAGEEYEAACDLSHEPIEFMGMETKVSCTEVCKTYVISEVPPHVEKDK